MEEWRIIEDFPDYLVSNHGRVKRKFKRVLKTFPKKNGYLCVSLMNKSRMKQVLVHRLVAKAFVEGYEEGLIVNHKDTCKQNNFASNLEWVDDRGNSTHYTEQQGSTSKFPGVYKHIGTWCAQISIEGKRYHLGKFKVEEEAAQIYYKALKVYEEKGLEAFIKLKYSLSKGSSKYMGVSYLESSDKWLAGVHDKGKRVLNKRFDTEEDAVMAVIKKYWEINRPLHFTHKEYLLGN